MENITIDRVRIVSVWLVLAEALLDALPHVVLFAEAVNIRRPIALLLGSIVSQVILTCEDDVLAVLAHVVAVAVKLVRVLSVWFVRAECDLVDVGGVLE